MKFKCLWYSIFCVLLVVITLNLVYAQHPHLDTIRERIETRTYPSIFAAWGGVGNPPPVLDRPDLSSLQQMALYGVHWASYFLLLGAHA